MHHRLHPGSLNIPPNAYLPYAPVGSYSAPVSGSHQAAPQYFLNDSIPASPALSDASLPVKASPSPNSSPSPSVTPHLSGAPLNSASAAAVPNTPSNTAHTSSAESTPSAEIQGLTFIHSTMEDVAEQIMREEYAPRKRRVKTKDWQKEILIGIFERETTMPDPDQRKEIGKMVDMTPRAVQVWFQNRRAKVRAEAAKAGNPIPPLRGVGGLHAQLISGGGGTAIDFSSYHGGMMGDDTTGRIGGMVGSSSMHSMMPVADRQDLLPEGNVPQYPQSPARTPSAMHLQVPPTRMARYVPDPVPSWHGHSQSRHAPPPNYQHQGSRTYTSQDDSNHPYAELQSDIVHPPQQSHPSLLRRSHSVDSSYFFYQAGPSAYPYPSSMSVPSPPIVPSHHQDIYPAYPVSGLSHSEPYQSGQPSNIIYPSNTHQGPSQGGSYDQY